ncbi:structural maintenance of chromosomes protein 6 [Pieris rapae]|uniref:structural maintenance of chromosomes protein 6 n=1 Tax=Pieris rapae TaxID=64459 RepID=UPI001E27AA64|nr:structural maintenance of chromosomes protein 6 [Pieris rapae]
MESENVKEEIDGSIHSIHVRNFFCHDNLEIKFNRNVNFIVGRNGSGKSALLTALVVGLGARASATDRGSNLHSFIKKGTNSATVEIKLRNSSPRAFKHDIYGDFITIVRTLNASGGSSYKVKSASGEVISTKFEEVKSIILAHDIQVDNPISVLNQDTVRTFHTCDAKKKYELFRQATNLEQTEKNYKHALENCTKAVSIWNRKNEVVQELGKEYKKWKNIHDQMQFQDEIEAKKKALQNEYYWSEIAELEHDVKTIHTECERKRLQVQQLMDRLKNIEQSYGTNTSAIDSLKQTLEECTQKKLTLEQELEELENNFRTEQSSQRSAQQTGQKLNELLAREKRKVDDLEREINNIESGSCVSQRIELEARVEKCRAAEKAARARYDTQQNDTGHSRSHAAHAQPKADRADERVRAQRSRLVQLKQQLRELESRGDDSLAVYGGNMVELCQLVKAAVARGEFSAPPRGPVGIYLKVKDKKWGGALEHIIKGSLKTFCVNTPEDSRKLFEIMRKIRYGREAKPGVTCSKFLSQVHNVSRRSVRAGTFTSALDALDIKDPVVANYLIDNKSLEKILLVPDHEDAMRLSDTRENVPMNCIKIVTLDSTEYRPAPNYRCYGGADRQPVYLQTSTSQRKAQLQANIKEAEQTLRSYEAEAKELNEEASRARDIERKAAQALQALLVDLRRKEEEAREATAALNQQQAPQHAILVDELKINKDQVRSLSEQVKSHNGQEQERNERINDIKEKIRNLRKKRDEVAVQCRNFREEIEQEQIKMEQGVIVRQTCEQRLSEGQRKLQQVEVILAEKKEVVDKKLQEALSLCPRVENPRERAVVTSELKKTQMKLNSLSTSGISRAQVEEKLLQVGRSYQRTQDALQRLDALIRDIKTTSNKHLEFCHKVQTYIARRVQYHFQVILSLRSYSGKMTIDLATGRLDMECKGVEQKENKHATSTASMSGGERSYATVAFMLALWDCVELPFYVMDEFDVFMDYINRKTTMELLLDHARMNKNRQYLFLTPQDASSVTAGPNVTIHVMANPRD